MDEGHEPSCSDELFTLFFISVLLLPFSEPVRCPLRMAGGRGEEEEEVSLTPRKEEEEESWGHMEGEIKSLEHIIQSEAELALISWFKKANPLNLLVTRSLKQMYPHIIKLSV